MYDEAALVRGAEKELRQFGRPMLPLQRRRREAYKYQEQPPSDHIENLDRYLIASSLVPGKKRLEAFRSDVIGCAPDGLVPVEYEEAMSISKKLTEDRKNGLWLLDDMDEEKYM